jgi:DNA polymerase III delta prime subunit
MARVFLGKSGSFEDVTALADVEGPSERGLYSVRFLSAPEKVYQYGAKRVALASEVSVSFDMGDLVYVDGTLLGHPTSVTRLESDNPLFGTRLAISWDDSHGLHRTGTFLAGTATFARPAGASSLFRYLAEVAKATRSDAGDPLVRDYLVRQFEGLEGERLATTAAGPLADPKEPCALMAEGVATIYPFGSNLSQMTAVDAALSSRLSLIQGPPGTGKTQTILNIIANLVLRGRSVLVVSPNNEATRNVSDKLEAARFGFIVAELGRRENRDAFVTSQEDEKCYPDDLKSWRLSDSEREATINEVTSNRDVLKELYERRRSLASDRERLRAFELEYAHFVKTDRVEPIAARSRSTPEHLSIVRDQVRFLSDTASSMPLMDRVRDVFLWGIGRWHDFDEMTVATEARLDRGILERDLDLARSEVAKAEEVLASHEEEDLEGLVRERSMALLRDALFRRYRRSSGHRRRTFDNPWKDPMDFRDEYPVITATTNSARAQMGKGGVPFDYVIIDESSQADLVTGFLALSSARNAVVVGDTHQLPCVISQRDRERARPCFESTGLAERYDFTRHSLLDCLDECVRTAGLQAPMTLLREHYRCDPDIIGFCNQQFYDGELIVMTKAGNPSRPALSCDLSPDANLDRKATFNKVQAEMFARDVLPSLLERYDASDIGVVTPYRKQADGMRSGLPLGVEVDTVHKFQGREKDAITLVTRSNDINGFIDSPNLRWDQVMHPSRSPCPRLRCLSLTGRIPRPPASLGLPLDEPVRHTAQEVGEKVPRVAYAVGYEERDHVLPYQAASQDVGAACERPNDPVARSDGIEQQVGVGQEGHACEVVVGMAAHEPPCGGAGKGSLEHDVVGQVGTHRTCQDEKVASAAPA